MRDKVRQLILESCREYNEVAEPQRRLPVEAAVIPLYGYDGLLDSLGLVTLLASLEQRIEDCFQMSVSLVDDRAASQTRSPFRDIDSLTDFTCTLLHPVESHG